MHSEQLTVSCATVRELVADQFPEWRDLPVSRCRSFGTDNAIFRVGDRFSARFPLRRGTARAAVESEADAARELAGNTRFATPEPVAIGAAGAGYPSAWLVQTWVPGATPTGDDVRASLPFAQDLADLIRAVRTIDTLGRTFRGNGRGGDLRAHDEWLATCFERSEGLMDVAAARRIWARLREVPPSPHPDVMNHGDLIPGNVLVSGGRLTGVIDVGGLGPADPALDLVCAWHLLGPESREVLRRDLDCTDTEWLRGMAWAFQQAMGLVWYYVDSNPAMAGLGRSTLKQITASFPYLTKVSVG